MHINRRNKLVKYIISLTFCVLTYEFRGHRYVPTIRSNRTDAPWNPSLISRYVARHGTNLWGINLKSE